MRSDAPAGTSTSLNAEFDYAAFEPSLRIAPFAEIFFIYSLVPGLAIMLGTDLRYKQTIEPNNESKWSDVYGMRLSAQVGIGNEIPQLFSAN